MRTGTYFSRELRILRVLLLQAAIAALTACGDGRTGHTGKFQFAEGKKIVSFSLIALDIEQ